MALISGKDGHVLSNDVAVADITTWSFQTTAKNVSYASSATGGYRRTLPGRKEGQGRFTFVLNTEDAVTEQISEGDIVELKLNVDDDNYYAVPAIVDAVHLDIDISEGSPVSGFAEFSSDGEWTPPTYS